MRAIVSSLFCCAVLVAQDPAAAWQPWLGASAPSPSPEALPALVASLLPLLESPDPKLRDETAFTLVTKWVYRERLLPEANRRELMGHWVSRLRLEGAAGTTAADAVAGRSFAALGLGLLVALDNEAPWLAAADVAQLVQVATTYLRAETDVRGFDERLGWLHSVAHTADLLKFLARSRHLPASGQADILAAIADKLAATSMPLVAGEDERLARAVLAIVARADFAAEPFAAWVRTAFAAPPPARPSTAALAQQHNRRHVLSSLHALLLAEARAAAGWRAATAAVAGALGISSVSAAAPAARPEDVASVDSLCKALYAVISGGVGEKRDWDRMRSLFHPSARMVPIGKGQRGTQARFLTVDDYVQRAGPMLERDGFVEREIARRTLEFGDFALAWSTYEAKNAASGERPMLRGINSIQFVREGGRWYVLQIVWQQEADAGPIPAEFLPAK